MTNFVTFVSRIVTTNSSLLLNTNIQVRCSRKMIPCPHRAVLGIPTAVAVLLNSRNL